MSGRRRQTEETHGNSRQANPTPELGQASSPRPGHRPSKLVMRRGDQSMILIRASMVYQLLSAVAWAAETVIVARSEVGVGGILALSPRSCPIRAQVSPPRGTLPGQGAVALFPEKRTPMRPNGVRFWERGGSERTRAGALRCGQGDCLRLPDERGYRPLGGLLSRALCCGPGCRRFGRSDAPGHGLHAAAAARSGEEPSFLSCASQRHPQTRCLYTCLPGSTGVLDIRVLENLYATRPDAA